MIRVNGYEIAAGASFPDGTLSLKLPQIIANENDIINMAWYYESDAELFTLICIRKHYANYKFHLYLPYVPHARMDRVKNYEDVFTLKYFCEVINSLDFSRVFIFDAHSYVAPALLDRVVNLSPEDDIAQAISLINENDLCLFYPDEGAMKRYSAMSDKPYAFGMKKRRWEDGKILGLDIMNPENVKDKNILIVDDICSRGGTFYHAAKALKEAGAKHIYLYVSHCEETIFKGEIFSSGLIDHVYTTQSIFKPEWQNEMITILE